MESETDALFVWQFDVEGACPVGCERDNGGEMCLPLEGARHQEL